MTQFAGTDYVDYRTPGPGPAGYVINPKALSTSQMFSLASRHPRRTEVNGVSPVSYQPNFSVMVQSAPQFSIKQRHQEPLKASRVAPNSYRPDGKATALAAPRYSLASRHRPLSAP